MSFKLDPVHCDHIAATFGELQTGPHESLIPLVVSRISIKPSQ